MNQTVPASTITEPSAGDGSLPRGCNATPANATVPTE